MLALRRGISKRYHSTTLPIAIDGWDTQQTEAVTSTGHNLTALVLDNYMPSGSDLALRPGFDVHVGSLDVSAANVNSLMAYSGTSNKMFAAGGAKIFDVTTSGSSSEAVTSLANDRWQHVNISTPGGRFLYIVNGVDTPYLYDGTTWTSITAASSPAITGVTTTGLNNIALHKSRLWFTQNDTLVAWFLPINSVGGAATGFDFRSIARLGGHLVAIGTWTLDSGNGPDDLIVFLTSRGEAIVYSGSDPATNFALVGLYTTSAPVGRRCMRKFHGDLLILTLDGVASMAQITRGLAHRFLSDPIRPTYQESSILYGQNPGFELFHFPRRALTWVNVPISTSLSEQYVATHLNIPGRKNPWCKFVGINAFCWEIFNNEPYFGGVNAVYKFWSGSSDNGLKIIGRVKPAFNSFGRYGSKKKFTLLRIFIRASGSPSMGVRWNVDYEDKEPVSFSDLPGEGNLNAGIWDATKWDKSVWGGAGVPFQREIAPAQEGLVGTPYIKTLTSLTEMRLVAMYLETQHGY